MNPVQPGRQVVGRRIGRTQLVRNDRAGRGKRHIGRHRRDDDEIDRSGVETGLFQRVAGGGQGQVGERLVVGRDPPLVDACALDDPLVRGVHHLREVVVRDHVLGRVGADARDRDRPVRGSDHDCSTAKVSVPRAASCPSTVARALPLPIGPRTCSSAHSS
jgi:hypothetical protein